MATRCKAFKPRLTRAQLAAAAFWTILHPGPKTFAQDLETSRSVVIRRATVQEGGLVRLHLAVSENVGGVPYPLATLDRSAIHVFASPDLDFPRSPVSLWTEATLPVAKRAVVFALDLDASLGQSAGTALRQAAAEALPILQSPYLGVVVNEGSGVSTLAAITPHYSENLKAIQLRLVDAQAPSRKTNAAGASRDKASTGEWAFCAASQLFSSWPVESLPDTKALVAVTGAGSALPSGKKLACFKRLRDLGVRLYWLGLERAGPEAAFFSKAAKASGGFSRERLRAEDFDSALSNVAANINDDYIVDVPMTAALPLTLVAQVSYHGNILRSAPYTIPGGPLAALSPASLGGDQGDEEARGYKELVLAVVLLGFSSLTVYKRFKRRRALKLCQTCQRLVRASFKDCPFRDANCVGRLVVVSGERVGRELPLFQGVNLIGTQARSCVRLKPRPGLKRRHARLAIAGERAVYEPLTKADRINGWAVEEPRLLADGHIISIGCEQFRFEAKP